MRIVAIHICLLCMPVLPAIADDSPTARTTDGPTFAAQLVGVDDGQITFRSGDDSRSVALTDLVRWSHPAEARRGPQVLLTDGSLLVGQPIAIVTDKDGQQFRMFADQFGEVQVSLSAVRGVVMSPPTPAPQRDRLTDSLTAKERQSDEVLLRNGDRLSGKLVALANGQVTIRTALGQVELPISKILSIALAPIGEAETDRPPKGLRTLVGFRDGSLVIADALRIAPDAVRLQLACGTELQGDTSSSVVSLQPSGGSAIYLSDLQPHTYEHIPFLDLKWPLGTDRSVLGARLRSAGRLYSKGLGMHSAARVTYLLPGEFRLFQSEMALDDSAGRQGSVVFRVFKSDGGDWQELFASPIMRGGDPPGSMSVDIRGAKAIALAVDFAERGDVLDNTNWLDARLIK